MARDSESNTPHPAPGPEIRPNDQAIVTIERSTLMNIERTDLATVAPKALFIPQSMGEAMELAKLMASGIGVPPDFRGKPANTIIIVMQAVRWGLDPFAVASKAYFVNDRVAYESQLVAAVVNSSPLLEGRLQYRWDGEGNARTCTVSGRLRDDDEIKSRTVTFAKAKKDNGSPLWTKDPDQQLAYYTQRAWARLYMPEILLGVYTPDELGSVVQPDSRRLGGGEAVQTTPRRGGAGSGGARVDQARAAALEAGVSTPAAERQAEDAAREAFVDQPAAAEPSGPWVAWKEQDWRNWLSGLANQFDTAPTMDVLDLIDSQTADERAAAPEWVLTEYRQGRDAARADIER